MKADLWSQASCLVCVQRAGINTYLCSRSPPREYVFPEFHSEFAAGKSSLWMRQEVVLDFKSNLLAVLMVESVSILTLVLLFSVFFVI